MCDLVYGKDYNYIVESMYCEYKLDVDRLKQIIDEYQLCEDRDRQIELLNEFHTLYPEYKSNDLIHINKDRIPNVVNKKIYFVQSPKGPNGLPSIHYSLKEKLLSDFRAKRKEVKNAMEKANHEGNTIESIRLNAKQLAIKVVCNSEYGASNNEHFAHYDPDIAAAVTFAARQLIGFLTCNLESNKLYIDRKFVLSNKKEFTWLINCKCISLSRYEGDDETLFNNRRHTLARLFDSNYNVVENDIIVCNIHKSSVIYQDTDSNYYINEYVIDYFTKNEGADKVDYDRDIKLEKLLDKLISGKIDKIECVECDNIDEYDVENNDYDEYDCDIDNEYDNDKVDNNEQIKTTNQSKSTNSNLICSPSIIDKCMHTMLHHNNLLSNFTEESAHRKPIGLGFEGSFIICRYLNRKKRYYGIKWSEDGTWIPSIKLPNPSAYIPNTDTLITNYTPYWVPKKTVIPQSNGEYIYLDDDKLLHSNVNYLDYVKKYNVKCTGIDLTRRDQYRFINYFHVMILQKDLRLMSYLGNDKWSIFPQHMEMQTVINDVVEKFRNVINKYRDIANFKSAELPDIQFNILDFARTAAYRANKQNIMTDIVARLRNEGKEQYIKDIGERMTYVTLLDEQTREDRLNGKNNVGKVADRSKIVDELLDELRSTYTENTIQNCMNKYDFTDKYTYEQWINAKAIDALDFKYYLECLCKSIALYIIGDIYPVEIKAIDEGKYTAKKANEIVSDLQAKIAKMYVNRYFNSGREISTKFKSVEKSANDMMKKMPKGLKIIQEVYPNICDIRDINLSTKQDLLMKLDKEIDNFQDVYVQMNEIWRNIETDGFSNMNIYSGDDIYEKYKNNKDGLYEQLKLIKFEIVKRQKAVEVLDKLKC